MRTVFFGATDLGYQCCERLLEMGEEVVAIFSIPREFRISYSKTPVKNVTYRDFAGLADRHRIPFFQVEGKMAEHRRAVEELRPDFGLAIGWYYLIPSALRELFPKGVAGLHASLLPLYRGGAPLVWAIIKGETESGVTLFYLSDGVDDGDIIAQKKFTIEADETIREVYEKATRASLELVNGSIPLIARGQAPRVAQDESKATRFPQRSPDDGLIDWNQDCETIRNFIRAQTKPYPGAFTFIGGKKVVIWDATVVPVDTE